MPVCKSILKSLVVFTALLALQTFPVKAFATPKKCERIVSLAPSITELIFKLELGNSLVGLTRYCTYPEGTELIKEVGGFWDPNFEVIATLKPDIVFLLSEDLRTRDLLEAIKIKAISIEHRNIAGILKSIKLIGDYCGKEEAGKKLFNTLKDEIEVVKKDVQGKKKKRTLVAVGRSSLNGSVGNFFISGDDGFYSDLLKIAGAENVLKRSTVALPSLSHEGLISLAPEVIIEVIPDLKERGWSKKEIKASWQKIPYLPAAKNNAIFVISEPYVAIPGPRFVNTLKIFVHLLHHQDKVKGEG